MSCDNVHAHICATVVEDGTTDAVKPGFGLLRRSRLLNQEHHCCSADKSWNEVRRGDGAAACDGVEAGINQVRAWGGRKRDGGRGDEDEEDDEEDEDEEDEEDGDESSVNVLGDTGAFGVLRVC